MKYSRREAVETGARLGIPGLRGGVAAGAFAIAIALPAPAQADDPGTKELRRSLKADQLIGRTSLEPSKHKSVRVRFAIRYPKVGAPQTEAAMHISVFTTKARATLVRNIDRGVEEHRGRLVRDSVRFGGKAAKALRNSGLGRKRTMQMVSLTSRDLRELDGDNNTDHTNMVTVVLADALGKPKPAGHGSSLGGPEIDDFTINNQSSHMVRLTAAPIGCMHDNGTSGSSVSALNGWNLESGENATTSIQNDKAFGDRFSDFFSLDVPSPTVAGETVVTPAYTDGLYNTAVKTLLFALINRYTSTLAKPSVYEGAIESLPPRGDVTLSPGCYALENSSNFVIGADRFVDAEPQPNPAPDTPGKWVPSPTDYKAALVAQIDGSSHIDAKELFYAYGLTVVWDNNYSLAIFDQAKEQCDQTDYFPGQIWMGCQLPSNGGFGGDFGDMRLTDLVIPGSHDSATVNLASNAGWLREDPTGGCSHYGALEGIQPGNVYNVASTQRLPMTDQLDAGIRYLDLRAAYDEGTPGVDPGGQWRFVHTMYALSSLRSEVQDIANWATTHPQEVVILDFNHVCSDDSSQPDSGELGLLGVEFAAKDPVTDIGLCDVAYLAPEGTTAAEIPATTLGQMRSSGRNVLVLASDAPSWSGCGIYPSFDGTQNNGGGALDGVPMNHLWPQEAGPGACPVGDDSASIQRITDFAFGMPEFYADPLIGGAPTLAPDDYYRDLTPAPFTQTQTQYTPTSGVIADMIIAECTLHDYEAGTLGSLRDSVIDAWGQKANIVIGDFVNEDDFIATLAKTPPWLCDPVTFACRAP